MTAALCARPNDAFDRRSSGAARGIDGITPCAFSTLVRLMHLVAWFQHQEDIAVTITDKVRTLIFSHDTGALEPYYRHIVARRK